jgi:outer membrane protein OmpA-like peptidoglycan-associated protein
VAPSSGAPVSTRSPAAASASAPAASPPAAPTAAEPTRARWTTLPDSDDCVELSSLSRTDFAKFPSKAECEAWVAARVCRPGFRCFDGCNWRQCDHVGSGIDQTLALCSPGIVRFVFASGQSKPDPSTKWAELVDVITTRLHGTDRKLLVRGYAAPDEAKNVTALARLAQARADAVARELVQRGIPRKKLAIEVGTTADLPQHDAERSLVVVSLRPEQPVRDDFEPSSSEYRLFCGAPSGK